MTMASDEGEGGGGNSSSLAKTRALNIKLVSNAKSQTVHFPV